MSTPEFLATAAVRIVPDTTGFVAAVVAASQTAAAAAAKSLTLPLAASGLAGATAATNAASAATVKRTAALQAQGAVLLGVTAEEKKLATATTVTASSAVKAGAAAAEEAAANRVSAKAARESAVAHSQMSRGFATATASQFGLRGAVLASSGPFLAAVVAVEAVKKSVDEASAEQEAAARVTAILGEEVGHTTEQWAAQQAALGLSTAAALKYAGAIEQVFKNVGVAAEENAKFSEQLVTRAADVAARSNVPVTQVLRAFQLALSGNLRGLRQFVPAVDAATIAQQAMADTGKKVKAELTTGELVLARYEILMSRSANQAGAFAERSGSLAQSTKVLSSNVANASAAFGRLVSPALSGVAGAANLAFLAIGKLKDEIKNTAPATEDAAGGTTLFGRAWNYFKPAAAASLSILRELDTQIEALIPSENAARGSSEALRIALFGIGNAASFAAINLNALRFIIASNAVSALSEHLTQLDIVGATSEQKIAALEQQQREAQKAVRTAPTVAARRQARETRRQAIDEIRSIRAADAAAAKSAAGAASSAASDAASAAADAKRKHDEDILTAQQQAQADRDIAAARADHTKSLVDDIVEDKKQLRLIEQQIKDAAAILDAQQRKQRIQELTLSKERAIDQLSQDKADQIQRRKDHLDLLRSRQEQRLQLDIEIANTNKNIRAEIAAREARIRFDKEQLKSVHGDIVRKKQLQLEIAQDTQAVKDLKHQTDAHKNVTAQLAFSLLQSQQGFASTILSNLLPTSGVAGSTTGGAISTRTAVGNPLPPPGTGFPGGVAADVSKSSQVSAGAAARGASASQMSILIGIQRSQLAILQGGSRRTEHPEAARAWAYSATEMLNTGW